MQLPNTIFSQAGQSQLAVIPEAMCHELGLDETY
jgi:hypothetical protein